MPMPDTRIAVDTNFLLDLAKPREVAHDALEVIHQRLRSAQIFVTITVVDELVTKERKAPDPNARELAHKALRNFNAWKVLAVELTDLQTVTARNIANKLIEQEIVPPEERNDALILAEAAVLGCQLLISSDSHLRDVDPARLALALGACSMPMVVIRKPDDIVRMFAGR